MAVVKFLFYFLCVSLALYSRAVILLDSNKKM